LATRSAAPAGGIVLALGPLTGAELALFTCSVLPDSEPDPRQIAVLVLRGGSQPAR
jgi:hypothetical protein